MLIAKCTTHEDKNAINDKYIVSVANTFADYFLCSCYIMFFFIFGRPKPSLKIKPVGSFIHLFCVEQLPELGADMNTMNDNNR